MQEFQKKRSPTRRPRIQFEIVSVKCQQNALEMVCKVILATQCLSVRVTCYLFQGSTKKGIKIVLNFFIFQVLLLSLWWLSLYFIVLIKKKRSGSHANTNSTKIAFLLAATYKVKMNT